MSLTPKQRSDLDYYLSIPLDIVNSQVIEMANRSIKIHKNQEYTYQIEKWIMETEEFYKYWSNEEAASKYGKYSRKSKSQFREPEYRGHELLLDFDFLTTKYGFPYKILFVKNDDYKTKKYMYNNPELCLPNHTREQTLKKYNGYWAEDMLHERAEKRKKAKAKKRYLELKKNKQSKLKQDILNDFFDDVEGDNPKVECSSEPVFDRKPIPIKFGTKKSIITVSNDEMNHDLFDVVEDVNAIIGDYDYMLRLDCGVGFTADKTFIDDLIKDICKHSFMTVFAAYVFRDVFDIEWKIVFKRYIEDRFKPCKMNELRPKIPSEIMNEVYVCFLKV